MIEEQNIRRSVGSQAMKLLSVGKDATGGKVEVWDVD